MSAKLANILTSIIVVILSFAGSLVAAEYIYRQFEPPNYSALNKTFLETVQYDPVLGWSLRPNSSEIFEKPFSFKTRIHINSDGMRYREVGEKKGARIVVIGDSVPWGWGVEEDERFTDIIERELGIEMINLSVLCYSPVQYYLLLDKALSYKPDLILLSFTLDNDFDNVVNKVYRMPVYQPYAALGSNGLQIKGYPIPNYRNFGKYKGNKLDSYIKQYALGRLLYINIKEYFPTLFKTLFKTQGKRGPKMKGLKGFSFLLVYREPNSPIMQHIASVNKSILQAIKSKVDSHNVPLVMLASRTRRDVNTNAYNLLKKQTDELNIPLIRLNVPRKSSLLLRRDSHWNAKGHKLIAKELKPYIKFFMYQHQPK